MYKAKFKTLRLTNATPTVDITLYVRVKVERLISSLACLLLSSAMHMEKPLELYDAVGIVEEENRASKVSIQAQAYKNQTNSGGYPTGCGFCKTK
jgi:hypothetical protein